MAVNEIRVHMIAGDGETSYTNNSAPQKIGISKALHVLDEGLKDMAINDKNGFSKCFKMADLGRSSGPNTLSVVSHIIDKIQQLSNKDQICPDEFQVFLNDLPGNDFNNLFKLLPQFYHKLDHHDQGTRSCFVSGVPGSIWFTHHTVSIGSLRFLKDWRAIKVRYTYQRRVHRRYLKLTESSFIEIYRHSSAQGAKNWYLEAVCGRCFERNRATLARREILRRL